MTDGDLRYLATLTDLESLEIVGSKIGSSGFQHLTGLSKVKYICMESSNVTDSAVPFLAQLPALQSAMIYGTKAKKHRGWRDSGQHPV